MSETLKYNPKDKSPKEQTMTGDMNYETGFNAPWGMEYDNQKGSSDLETLESNEDVEIPGLTIVEDEEITQL